MCNHNAGSIITDIGEVGKMIRVLIIMAATMAMTTGCTKKRPKINQQGQIVDLLKISEIDGQSFKLTTGEQFARSNNTAAEEFSVENKDNFHGITDYGFVSYNTTASLMETDLQFRGKENSDYELVYKLKPKHRELWIYKRAPLALIPHDERMLADNELSQGDVLAIPVMGLPSIWIL